MDDLREKVIKALECRLDINHRKYKHCFSCKYRDDIDHLQRVCMTDSIFEDAITLLKDPDLVKVVRCGDCRYWKANNAEEGDSSGTCMNGYSPAETTDMNWFCADGERK